MIQSLLPNSSGNLPIIPYLTLYWISLGILCLFLESCTPTLRSGGNEGEKSQDSFSEVSTPALFALADKGRDSLSYLANPQRFKTLTKQYETLLERCSQEVDLPCQVRSLIGLSNIKRDLGLYEMAEYYLDSALKEVNIHPDAPDTLLGELWLEKAYLAMTTNQPDEIYCYSQQALDIYREVFGERHPKVAHSNHNLGHYYSNTGQHAQAVLHLNKAMDNLQGIKEANSKDWAYHARSLGYIYYYKGVLDSSEIYIRKAQGIYEKTLGYYHPEMAFCMGHLGLLYYSRGQYDSALDYYNKTLDIQVNTLDRPHPNIAQTFRDIGNTEERLIQFYKAESNFLASLEEYEALYGPIHLMPAWVYQDLGDIHTNMWGTGDSKKALEYKTKSLEILLQLPDPPLYRMLEGYGNLGNALNEMGYYEKGLIYTQKALNLIVKAEGSRNPGAMTMLDNLGFTYEQLDQPEVAEKHHKRFLSLCLEVLGKFDEQTGFAYFHLGRDLYKMKKYDEAILYFEEAKLIWEKVLPAEHFRHGMCNTMLGHIAFEQGLHEKAFAYYSGNIQRYKGIRQLDPAYLYLGTLFIAKASYDEALDYYQQALISTVYDFNEEDISHNPLPSEAYNDGGVLIKALSGKAKALALRAETRTGTSRESDFQLALKTTQLLKDWVGAVRLDFEPGLKRVKLMNVALPAYELAVQLLYNDLDSGEDTYKKLDHAFSFFQARKSHSLLESTIEEKAKHFAGIPDKLLADENEIHEKLSYLSRHLQKLEAQNQTPDTVLVEIRDSVFQAQYQFDRLTEKLEADYPSYYQLKYQVNTASLEEVQSALIPDQNTAVIEYLLGDSSLYILGISRQDANLVQIPVDDLFHLQLDTLRSYYAEREGVLGRMNAEAYIISFAQLAHSFYEKLIDSVLQSLSGNEDIQSLILIPEGKLNYLPFDALLTELPTEGANNFASLPYAIRKYQIRCGYSSSLLLESKEHLSQASKFYAGFAPEYSQEKLWAEAPDIQATFGNVRDQLDALKNNQPEVIEASDLFNGKPYLKEEASEQVFKEEASNYKVLHLAMHAFTDDANPMNSCLVFADPPDLAQQILAAKADSLGLEASYTQGEDGRLYAYEIYNLPLNADLAVLSACNTGAGSLRKGEGVMSLARAFAYAGCPNIVMSLWQADDQATKDLMQDFYVYLKDGLEKDEALRQAKLDYLDRADLTHPHFWSGFVMIGDDAPIIAL